MKLNNFLFPFNVDLLKFHYIFKYLKSHLHSSPLKDVCIDQVCHEIPKYPKLNNDGGAIFWKQLILLQNAGTIKAYFLKSYSLYCSFNAQSCWSKCGPLSVFPLDKEYIF